MKPSTLMSALLDLMLFHASPGHAGASGPGWLRFEPELKKVSAMYPGAPAQETFPGK